MTQIINLIAFLHDHHMTLGECENCEEEKPDVKLRKYRYGGRDHIYCCDACMELLFEEDKILTAQFIKEHEY